MDTIQCFRHDQWLAVAPAELQAGDQFQSEGQSVIVTGEPKHVDGVWKIPVAKPEPLPIQIDVSNGVLARVMDYAGTGLQLFQDGTAILADLEYAPGFVYSPRLPKAELEAFCQAHLDRYQAFFEANKKAILEGESVAMTAWWKND